MEKDTDRPSSPIITEEGIKWRIESPPNRHIEETDRREKLANTNGKGIKKEDSILVDDPVMPWAEDEYDNTVLLSNSNNPINSQSIVKEQNVISSTTNTEMKSSVSGWSSLLPRCMIQALKKRDKNVLRYLENQ